MKTAIHPEYVESPRPLHLRQRVHHALHERRDPRRDLLELPPVLHGQAEAGRHRRPRRALQAPRRQARRGERRPWPQPAPPEPVQRLRGTLGASARRTRRRPGRPRGRDDARRLHVGRRRAQPLEQLEGGDDRRRAARSSAVVPESGPQAPPRRCACRSSAASSRSWESLAIGFKALGISANAQLPEDEEAISGGTWVGTVVVALGAGGRPVLPAARSASPVCSRRAAELGRVRGSSRS